MSRIVFLDIDGVLNPVSLRSLPQLDPYLNQKIAETEREIRAARNDIHNTEREIDNLRIRREHFCAWPHIRQAIARFDLKLQPADPRQVRKLVVIPPALAPQVSVASRAPGAGENRRTPSVTRWSQR